MKQLIDLSHSIADGKVTYPGVTPPKICDFLSREASKSHYADGVTFCINQIDMPANTGTYIDSPFHRYADGKDLAHLPLESVAELDIMICDVRQAVHTNRAIDSQYFKKLPHTLAGKALLVYTGWAQHWGTEHYNHDHPYLTRDAADYLHAQNVQLVGIDSLNIDDIDDGHRPAHSILLGSDIPIIEHMCNLDALPEKLEPNQTLTLYAAPVKIHQFGTFPVRVYAVLTTL